MEQVKEVTPVEIAEEIVVEATEEVKEAPSRLREKLRALEDMWRFTSIQYFQSPKN